MKQEQIEAELDEIRGLYDRLISEYSRPPVLKEGFNERYYDAIRMRMELGSFFKTEKGVVLSLIEQASELIRREKEEK